MTKEQIKALTKNIQGLAQREGLTSVHAYKVCCRHLTNAVRTNPGPARRMGVEHAYTHFQFLKAAAAEKASRGR